MTRHRAFIIALPIVVFIAAIIPSWPIALVAAAIIGLGAAVVDLVAWRKGWW